MDTKIDVDQDLVRAAMAATGQTTMRDAVEEALRKVVLLDIQRRAVVGSQGGPGALGKEDLVEPSLDAAGQTAVPSRFRKGLGTAGPGETTDEIMQWLRPAHPQVVERAVALIENASAARTPAEERAVDAFLKEIGAA